MKFQGFRDLMARYTSTFKYFWGIRKELTAQDLTHDEAEFLPAVLAIQAKPVSPVGRWVGRILMLMVVFGLAWSIFGHMDIIVNASGKIIPSGRTKTISVVELARVQAIHVQDGQKVKAGDVLLELDTSMIETDQGQAQSEAQVATLKAARATALLDAIRSGRTPRMGAVSDIPAAAVREESYHLDGEWRNYQAQKQRLLAQIDQFQQMLPIATQQARDYGTLAKTRDVSTHDWQDKQKALMDIQRQLSDARQQLAVLTSSTQKDALDALNEARRVQNASEQQVLKAKAHNALLQVTAPVDGTVQQLQVNTIGASVPAAQPLMQIVPDETRVEVEAQVENKDVGFIHEGQEVEVKIDAFEYTKYGTVKGTIVSVSKDAVSDEKKDPATQENRGLLYSVRIGLNQKTIAVDGKDMPLTAGMSVRTEVKTGQRRVIEYVLSPLMKYKQESLNER